MRKFEVRVCGKDAVAYKRDGEVWQDAAGRAIRRALGRAAWANSWQIEGREVTRDNQPMRLHFKATVVGPANRDGSRPILGEARAALWDSEMERG